MPTVRANGADLYYQEYGSGDEIVISCQQSFAEDSYPERLAQPPTGYHVFAVVARGFLPSSRVHQDPGQRWYSTWAEDVCHFARALGVDRFIYTGVSHGAVIGWHLAVEHPAVLKALVSVVGAPHDRATGTAISQGRRAMAEAMADPSAMRRLLEGLFAPPRDEARRALRDQAIERRVKRTSALADPDGWAPRIGKGFPEISSNEGLASLLARIRVPTLVLGGLHDPLCKPEDNLRAARAVPGAKLVLWEDAGHMLTWERPDDVLAEVKLFVDELNGNAV